MTIVATGLAGRPLFAHRNLSRPQRTVGGPSYTMPLDIQNGTSAWGLYQLRTAYTGNLLKVRRSSDNTTQDIGFDPSTGALDTAALLSFCGAGNGFVHTAYDQTGNGRNWTQTGNNAFQPQIVSSGAVITGIGGLPALKFDGSNDLLTGSTLGTLMSNSEGTAFLVWNNIDTTTTASATYNGAVLFEDASGFAWYTLTKPGGLYKANAGNWDTNEDKGQVGFSITTDYVSVWQHTGGNVKNYLNSQTAGATAASGNTGGTADAISLGGDSQGVAFNGYMTAALFYQASVSSGNLNSIGAALAALYGISWS